MFDAGLGWIDNSKVAAMAIEELLHTESSIGQSTAFWGQMTIRPEPRGLCAARAQIRRVAGSLDFAAEDIAGFVLAVGEAVSNAYRHGTPSLDRNFIYLGWRFADDILTVTVKDEGTGFGSRADGRADWPIRTNGYGIDLMRRSVDEVHFEFDAGTIVTLTKRLPATSY